MKIKTTIRTVFILTAIIFFGLVFNLLDFDFGNEASAVIYSNKWQMDNSLADADASFLGEANEDISGIVSPVGDVNNDGFDDFLIGAYKNDESGNSAGQTYLILGKSSGWQMDTNLSNADASFIGEAIEDESGIGVSSAGDVNNDGFDDFLIGAPSETEENTSGQTYLILGKSSGWQMDTNLSNADASFIGEAIGDASGYSVSSAGDVNNDGFDDFLIGAYKNDEGGNSAGQTYLILGKSSGWQMDTNLSNADASFIGEDTGSTGNDSGASVSSAGDVNNDGFDDFLIGALYNDEGGSYSGQTYLILGKSSGWQMDVNLSNVDASFIGEANWNVSGGSVSSAGDVNNDGFDDFLIGAYGNDERGSYSGQTYLILGKSSGWQMDVNLSNADASFLGEDVDDLSGISVSSAGDVNNDGFDDFLIGAFLNDEGGNNGGQTYLILGKSSGWQMDTNLFNSDASFLGEEISDFSGVSVFSAGDVNNDGFDDFLIGAYGNDEGGNDAGQTYLILGEVSQCAEETNDCSSISCCSSPPAPEPLTCVDYICDTCLSLNCSADNAEDNSISEMGDAIDDDYCTWNIHDGCLVKEGVETIDGSNNPSYWEGENCVDTGSSDLWGEKRIYINDINDYNIKGKVCVDDYNSFWINGAQVNVLENGSTGCKGLIDVRSFFQTGWNTIKFKAVDTCSDNRYMDIDWQIIPRAPALNGIASSSSKIKLSWDDRGTGVTYGLWNSDIGTYIYSGDQTSFVHTGLDANTTYSYEVIATKNGYDSDWSNTVSATTWNQPPVADAGSDQFVIIGSSVNLDGSGSNDPDGDPITYDWTFNSMPGASVLTDTDFSDETIVNPNFIPDVIGVYHIDLIVTDSYGGFDTDGIPYGVSITVANPPPVCGNNKVEGSEECDGTDKDACGEQYCIPVGQPGECTCQKSMPAWKEVHPKN